MESGKHIHEVITGGGVLVINLNIFSSFSRLFFWFNVVLDIVTLNLHFLTFGGFVIHGWDVGFWVHERDFILLFIISASSYWEFLVLTFSVAFITSGVLVKWTVSKCMGRSTLSLEKLLTRYKTVDMSGHPLRRVLRVRVVDLFANDETRLKELWIILGWPVLSVYYDLGCDMDKRYVFLSLSCSLLALAL